MPQYNNLVTSPLEERLYAYIEAEGLAPHQRLTAERALCQHFSVSRMTLRSAVKKLCAEGVLYSKVGSGTYLAPPRWQRDATYLVDSPSGYREDRRARTTALSVKKRRMRADIAWEMGWDPAQDCYELRLLTQFQRQPLSLETTFIPAQLCPYLERGDILDSSRLLREVYGLVPAKLLNSVNLVPVEGGQAERLEVSSGAWAVQEKKRYTLADGTVVKYSVVLTPFQRVCYTVDLTGDAGAPATGAV